MALDTTRKAPKEGTREFITNDLQQLIGRSVDETKTEGDMPPLLQVSQGTKSALRLYTAKKEEKPSL